MIHFEERWIDIGWPMHVCSWEGREGEKRPFLLVHGLSSNAATWGGVANELARHGHPVVAIDQRGHGLSHKPPGGYDFATAAADLRRLIGKLGWESRWPVLAGQSWGGNVLLAFGHHFPGIADRLIFVDGGFLDLSGRGTWEEVSTALRPPQLSGMRLTDIRARIQQANPTWAAEGIEATLANFEHLEDGTIRPWLSLENHMKILRALYEQKPQNLFSTVKEPVLICAAEDGSEWTKRKRRHVQAAVDLIPGAEVVWFPQTAHDIHVHRPHALAKSFLNFINQAR